MTARRVIDRLKDLIAGFTGDATGDLYYRDSGGNFARLGIGSTGQLLKVVGGLPAWADLSAAWSTWTPTLTPQSGSLTTTTSNCFYNQFGKLVVIRGNIAITNPGTASGFLDVSLPVTARDTYFAITGSESAGSGNSLSIYGVTTTTFRVWFYNTTTVLASGRAVQFTGLYEAA